jgi:hypothetical protein
MKALSPPVELHNGAVDLLTKVNEQNCHTQGFPQQKSEIDAKVPKYNFCQGYP